MPVLYYTCSGIPKKKPLLYLFAACMGYGTLRAVRDGMPSDRMDEVGSSAAALAARLMRSVCEHIA